MKHWTQAEPFKGETTMRETPSGISINRSTNNSSSSSSSSASSNSRQTVRRFTAHGALAVTLAVTVMGTTAMGATAMGTSAMGMGAAPGARAAGNSSKNTDSPANVVGHVSVSGGNVKRMLLVKRNGKEYLVLGLDSAEHVAMVDVSDPRRPQNVDTAAPAGGKRSIEVNVVADTLSVFGESEMATTASADPKEIRSLTGVTAFLIDGAHGLIYAANSDGVWIVKTKRQAAEDARPDYYGG
jgi:hypothetical protein